MWETREEEEEEEFIQNRRRVISSISTGKSNSLSRVADASWSLLQGKSPPFEN